MQIRSHGTRSRAEFEALRAHVLGELLPSIGTQNVGPHEGMD